VIKDKNKQNFNKSLKKLNLLGLRVKKYIKTKYFLKSLNPFINPHNAKKTKVIKYIY
jgi:hypothetical protein